MDVIGRGGTSAQLVKDALVGKAEQAALDVPTDEEKTSTVNERAGGGEPFARKWHFVWGKDYIDELVAGYHYNDQGVASRNVFLQDANWNVVAVLDATGIFSAWASVGYEPYGEFTYFEDRAVAAYCESQGNPCPAAASWLSGANQQYDWPMLHGHQGLFVDRETGYYYNRGRIYDAKTGRFLSQDPHKTGRLIGTALLMNAQMHMAFIDFQAQGRYADGMNLYQYLRSNPINLTDPSGEIAPFVAMLLGGAVAGAVGGGIAEIINNPDWTWGGVFGSAGKGALAGTAGAAAAVGAVAAFGASAGSIYGLILAGAADGAASGAVGAAMRDETRNVNDVLMSALGGAAFGAGTGAFTRLFGSLWKRIRGVADDAADTGGAVAKGVRARASGASRQAFDGVDVGDTLIGVYDFKAGVVHLNPANDAKQLSGGFTQFSGRLGSHEEMVRHLGIDAESAVGFAIQKNGANSFDASWTSRFLNGTKFEGFGGQLPPDSLQPKILDALDAMLR